MKSKILIAAIEWLWSLRGTDIWLTPGVLTKENKDPASPNLTIVEAISIFKYLHEKGLIFPAVRDGRPVFCLHESKIQEWNTLIECLKKLEHKENDEKSSPIQIPDNNADKKSTKQDSGDESSSDSTKKITPPNGDDGVKTKFVWFIFGALDAGVILLFWGYSEFFGSHNSPILSNICFFGFTASVLAALAGFTYKALPYVKTICIFYVLLCGLFGIIIYAFAKPMYQNVIESKPVETVKSSATNAPPEFSIHFTWSVIRQPGMMRYIDDEGMEFAKSAYGEKVVPVIPFDSRVIVELVNLRHVPLMIASYEIETEMTNGTWARADLIPEMGINQGRVFEGYDAFTNVTERDYTSFDSVIQNRNIAPNETIRGWLFFRKYPDGDIRFRLIDTLGNAFTVPIKYGIVAPNMPAGQMPWAIQDLLEKKTTNVVDFRSLYLEK